MFIRKLRNIIFIFKKWQKYLSTNMEFRVTEKQIIKSIRENDISKLQDFVYQLCKDNNERLLNVLIDHCTSINKIILKLLLIYKNKEKVSNKKLKNLFKKEIEGKKILKSIINYCKNDISNYSTPISMACYYNNKNIVKSFIYYGANVNLASKNGKVPIIIACSHSNKNIVEYLVESGAKINEKNQNGDTALLISYKKK